MTKVSTHTDVSNNDCLWIKVPALDPCPTGTHEWKLIPFIPRWGWSWVRCVKCGAHSPRDTDSDRELARELPEGLPKAGRRMASND